MYTLLINIQQFRQGKIIAVHPLSPTYVCGSGRVSPSLRSDSQTSLTTRWENTEVSSNQPTDVNSPDCLGSTISTEYSQIKIRQTVKQKKKILGQFFTCFFYFFRLNWGYFLILILTLSNKTAELLLIVYSIIWPNKPTRTWLAALGRLHPCVPHCTSYGKIKVKQQFLRWVFFFVYVCVTFFFPVGAPCPYTVHYE